MPRLPYMPRENDPLIDAGTARATPAPSTENPNGTAGGAWARDHQNRTVTQQRATYFDPHHTNTITPAAAYRGFRNFGWSIPLTLFAMLVIHLGLSCATQPTILPDPLFRVGEPAAQGEARQRQRDVRHGGRFRPQSFEDVFAKYDGERKGGPSGRDVWAMWDGQRCTAGFYVGGGLEFRAGVGTRRYTRLGTYLLLWPEDGIMRKTFAASTTEASSSTSGREAAAEGSREAREAGEKEKAKEATKQQAEKDSEHSRQDSGG